jgi:hypothetical protein
MNGVKDPSEPGLAGWTVRVSGPFSTSTRTDAAGAYAVTGLPVGTYTVCVVPPAGWFQTAPRSGPPCARDVGWSLVVTSAQRFDAINFGYSR